jgi:hypothetical protein
VKANAPRAHSAPAETAATVRVPALLLDEADGEDEVELELVPFVEEARPAAVLEPGSGIQGQQLILLVNECGV